MKTVLRLFLLVIFCQTQIFSQIYDKNKLDSLFDAYKALKTHKTTEAKLSLRGELPVKCGTPLAAEVRVNMKNFSAYQQSVLKQLSDRPVTDTSIVSPNQHFRIHYNIAGYDVPLYSVQDFAIALDSAYNFEVNYLGYPAPPPDNGAGGDDLYDVYIQNIGSNYGYTQPEDNITANTYYTYMVVDDDFHEFPTTGINAARVTAAHEFHHAIQISNYIYRSEDHFFLELTSTSMEEFVYNSINDYYFYMNTYFENPSRCFSDNDVSKGYGYDLAIWNLFQKKNFGFDIIKREWELLRDNRALKAIDLALKEHNTTFIEQYNLFGLWCYFTDYRSKDSTYFPEAANYHNLIKPLSNYYMAPPSSTDIDLNAYVASNNYLNIINVPQIDTIMILITNGDVNGAVNNVLTSETCSFSQLYNSKGAGYTQISPAYYTKLTPSVNPLCWIQGAILNNQILDGTIASGQLNIDYAFPSPFSYKKNSMIYLPITNSETGVVDFNIYSPSMKLVYSSSQQVFKYINNKVIRWNALDNSGNKLPTGVYIYAIKTTDDVLKGKIAIVK